MKKNILVIIFAIVAIILILGSLIVYAKSQNDEEIPLEEKVFQEMKYLNEYFISILGNINGIVIETNIVQENSLQLQLEINTNSKEETKQTANQNEQQNTETNSTNQENSNNNTQTNTTSSQDESMQKSILANKGDYKPDWDKVRLQIEQLYQIWNTVSVDLHAINVDSNLILAFSDKLNTATQNVKNEDKTKTIDEIVKMYELLMEYTKKCAQDAQKTSLLTIQYNIVSAYAHVTNENWENAATKVQEAQDKSTNLLNTVSNDYQNQVTLNRSYILVNELKNAIQLKDKEIFYLQYENLITQLGLMIG